MELVIKLDMENEEYKNYVDKTTEEIIYSEDFKHSLAEVIKSSFAKEIGKQANKFVNKSLYGSYYDSNDNITISKQLAKEALSEYAESVKAVFADYAKELMAGTDLDNIIKTILMDAMFSGIQEGMKDFYTESRDIGMMNSADISRLKCKLGID